jgi:hypothetical protein
MLLFIDVDADSKTGWMGYDYMVNASVLSKYTADAKWEKASNVTYKAAGNKLEMRVPRSIFGPRLAFDFHWADNVNPSGDISDFALNGDNAPDRRFNYHFEQAM